MARQDPISSTPGPTLANLVQGAADHLADYFAALRPHQWDLPSGAQGWTLADIMGHLASGASSYAHYVQRALQGETSPPPGVTPGPAHQDPGLAQAIAQRAKKMRQDAGTDLLKVYRQRHAELQHLLGSVQPEDWERPCFHRLQLTTIRGLTLTRLGEISFHTWDLKGGLEPSPRLLPKVVPVLVEWLPTWFSWGFYPQRPLDRALRYRFHLREPRPVAWDVAVLGDRFQVEPLSDDPPTVTFRCDPETAELVFVGRVPWRQAQEQGPLAVEGDASQAEAFFRWFRGV